MVLFLYSTSVYSNLKTKTFHAAACKQILWRNSKTQPHCSIYSFYCFMYSLVSFEREPSPFSSLHQCSQIVNFDYTRLYFQETIYQPGRQPISHLAACLKVNFEARDVRTARTTMKNWGTLDKQSHNRHEHQEIFISLTLNAVTSEGFQLTVSVIRISLYRLFVSTCQMSVHQLKTC